MEISTFWDNRYTENETVYGNEPNIFFREFIDKAIPRSLLLPCEGEGRNAIYAAGKGWLVDAFDFSRVAVQKALQRAEKENLSFHYVQKSLEDFESEKKYKLIASIYVHMGPTIRQIFHHKIIDSLEDGGAIILEAFSKKQIQFQSGGPRDVNMMYSKQELLEDFANLKIEVLEEVLIDLEEGGFHKGEASVVRMIAVK
ncbi:MAG: class I SAM-dependent methyltransferase [Bacteroidota bacterium]|nr:class I SAM-dependent methyltransferase [Bacteroidota bacterium]